VKALGAGSTGTQRSPAPAGQLLRAQLGDQFPQSPRVAAGAGHDQVGDAGVQMAGHVVRQQGPGLVRRQPVQVDPGHPVQHTPL